MVQRFVQSLRLRPQQQELVRILLVLALRVASVSLFSRRSLRFAQNPTVPFSVIAQRYGYRYNSYPEKLGLQNASVLLPDVGATLYYSDLRVYDLGGLTDRTIAKTLERDPQAFYAYVFDVAKPTFIHTHENWTYVAALDGNPQFRRDYMPIHEYVDRRVQESYGLALQSGDYVRKDAVANKADVFAQMQREIHSGE